MNDYVSKFIPTGNEQISIPDVREQDAAIMGITFLLMKYRGLVEIRGNDKDPFMKPFVAVNGQTEVFEEMNWDMLDYWIPRFKAEGRGFMIEGIILAPINERGFAIQLKIRSKLNEKAGFTAGLKGCWIQTNHEINESKPVNAKQYAYESGWNHSVVFDLRDSFSIFSFAPIFEENLNTFYHFDNSGVHYSMDKSVTLNPGEEMTVRIYWGFGFEEVGSATAAKEMLRKGFDYELQSTRKWLKKRIRTTGDKELDRILNRNLFFNFFFASGLTLDTEEFVLVTSRSPRYYVSAAYWDRDSLYWSMPSILLVDQAYAKEMLDYVYRKQIRNVGIHSRYIDGTVLEPGFELDELCAPLLALCQYVKSSGDEGILREPHICHGIDRIINILETKKHPDIDLYETFLQPTDDMALHPYLTYCNVLVWKAFNGIIDICKGTRSKEFCNELSQRAKRVKAAILKHCIVEYDGKQVFAWSVDLNGKWNIYDEPPGSLQLLPFHGFCDSNEPVYINTVEIIRRPEYKYSFSDCSIAEIGCEHAPHPWILSVANSLLCGRKEHCRDILMNTSMDNGIACESVDENTGECTTGAAFATCAGFLAYSIYYAFGEKGGE